MRKELNNLLRISYGNRTICFHKRRLHVRLTANDNVIITRKGFVVLQGGKTVRRTLFLAVGQAKRVSFMSRIADFTSEIGNVT